MPDDQGAEETRVEFLNPDNQRLVGIFTDAGSKRTVILCHGYTSNKDGFVNPALSNALASRGISSLRFDFRGNGESEGSFGYGNYLQEAADLRCAVQFLRERLQREPGAVVGHSKGANVVLLYASQYDDIPLVMAVAGRFDVRKGIKERFGEELLARLETEGQVPLSLKSEFGKPITLNLTKKAMKERLSIDMEDATKRIKRSKVVIVHGTADTVASYEDAEALSRTIPLNELWLFDGANHHFRTTPHMEQLIERAVERITNDL